MSICVLEYVSGRLFDLFYYTEKLEPIIVRTYFRQLVSAISYMHENGIIHRDIKRENLLLDHNYTLKVTGFTFAKIDKNGNSNITMNDWNIGRQQTSSKGFQAPEILLKNKPYNKKIDIFSMGVVLFILLGGYPPFENAKTTDKWYQFIINKKYKNFWKSHRNCGLKMAETDLITRMICYDTQKRISLDKIKKHPWYLNKEIVNCDQLKHIFEYRHKQLEQIRNTDPNKQKILQNSACRCLYGCRRCGYNIHKWQQELNKYEKLKMSSLPPLLPQTEIINAYDIYTSTTNTAFEVLLHLQRVIVEDLKGDLVKPYYNTIPVLCDKITDNASDFYIDIPNFSLEFKCM
eukprot:345345_1